MQSINKNLPKYEFKTTSLLIGEFDKPHRPIKTLSYHPTKKVARSNKGKKIAQQTTLAIIEVMNAQNDYQELEKKLGRELGIA